MSIDLPFNGNGRRYKTCPYCGSQAGLSEPQNWWVCLRGGCPYEEPAGAPESSAQVSGDNRAILKEFWGVEGQEPVEVPAYLVSHMGHRIAPHLQEAVKKADALLAKLQTQRALDDIAKRPSIRDRRP